MTRKQFDLPRKTQTSHVLHIYDIMLLILTGKRVIRRDISVSMDGLKIHSARPDLHLGDIKKDFCISDAMYFAKCGMEVQNH